MNVRYCFPFQLLFRGENALKQKSLKFARGVQEAAKGPLAGLGQSSCDGHGGGPPKLLFFYHFRSLRLHLDIFVVTKL